MHALPDRGSLIEFSFVSCLDGAMPAEVLARLVRQVWRSNTEAGLTGRMAIRGREVEQVVEGDVEAVLPLASRILADARHGGIRVLAFGPLESRRHEAWQVDGFSLPANSGAIASAGGRVVSLWARRQERSPGVGTRAGCAVSV